MSAPRHPIGFVGYIATDGWAGVVRWPVEVIGYTPKRYRVRILPCPRAEEVRFDCGCAGPHTVHQGALPSFHVKPGDEVLVPLRVVRPLRDDARLRQEVTG